MLPLTVNILAIGKKNLLIGLYTSISVHYKICGGFNDIRVVVSVEFIPFFENFKPHLIDFLMYFGTPYVRRRASSGPNEVVNKSDSTILGVGLS